MSAILKALKKAQGAGESRKAPLVSVRGSGKKGKLLLIPVALCAAALVYFFSAFLIKDSTPTVAEVPGMGVRSAPVRTEAPAGAGALNEQAVAHIRAGRLEEAEELLKEALSKHPGDPRLHNHLGLALKRQGRAPEAISEYQKALERKPDYFVAMNNLAVALEAEGREAEALERYQAALAGDPTLSGAHLNYALLLEKQGRAAEAEGHYRAFLELSDDENLKGLVRRRLRALD